MKVKVVACSGTIAKRSILDFAHIAQWCAPDDCPFPLAKNADGSHKLGYVELQNWAKALDEGVPDAQRGEPGALSLFSGGDHELAAVRRGVQRRIFETPGFVATRSSELADCSLTIECHQIPVPADVDMIFSRVKQTWEKPNGDEIESAATLWAVCRALACGFYHRWDPPAPPFWLLPRREWHAAVREVLSNSRHLFSLDDVQREIKRRGPGEMFWGEGCDLFETYQAWKDVEKQFIPNPIVTHVSDYAVDWVGEWLDEHPGALIWTEWPAFGQRLARRFKIPYYGAGGVDTNGVMIEQHGERAKEPLAAVASIEANKEGRNLQTIFDTMLFTSCPTTAGTCEQAIGRCHRQGQKSDNVEVHFMVACREQERGFVQAMRDAGFHSELLGTDMKIYLDGAKSADILIPEYKRSGGAWAEPRTT